MQTTTNFSDHDINCYYCILYSPVGVIAITVCIIAQIQTETVKHKTVELLLFLLPYLLILKFQSNEHSDTSELRNFRFSWLPNLALCLKFALISNSLRQNSK